MRRLPGACSGCRRATRVLSLRAALCQICADLTRTDHPFALVGGLAVSARTEPRFTRDADIAVAVSDDTEAEALIRTLRGAGYDIEAIVEQEAVGRLATARLSQSQESSGPVIDLLFASSGIEPEVVADADDIELLPQLRVHVAAIGHLIALKVLARDDVNRPQGAGDLRDLQSELEEAVARATQIALTTIQRAM